jgi:hypothetical protein
MTTSDRRCGVVPLAPPVPLVRLLPLAPLALAPLVPLVRLLPLAPLVPLVPEARPHRSRHPDVYLVLWYRYRSLGCGGARDGILFNGWDSLAHCWASILGTRCQLASSTTCSTRTSNPFLIFKWVSGRICISKMLLQVSFQVLV